MDKQNNEKTEWKQEVERAERKQRLANLKDSDGKKKKIKTSSSGGRAAGITVLVILILVIAVWLIASLGVIPRTAKAVTVTNDTIPGASLTLSPAEMNIELGNLAMQSQLGYAFSDEMQDKLSRKPNDQERSLRDNIVDMTVEQVKNSFAMVLAMQNDENFKLSDERLAEIDEQIEQYEKDFVKATQAQGVGVGAVLKNYFGPGVTTDTYMKTLRRSILVQEYAQFIEDSATADEAEKAEYAEENAADLQIYDFSTYTFHLQAKNEGEEEEEITAEEKEKMLQELKEDALEALALVDKGEMTFKEAMIKYEKDDDKAADLEEQEESMDLSLQGDRISPLYKEWVTDPEREEGDYTAIETSHSVIAIRYHGSGYEDYNVYSVRHILIDATAAPEQPNSDLARDAQIKAKAEELLEEYRAGEATEESFAAMAKEYSQDPGSAENGGLYEDVAYGTMVKPFEEWALDKDRKEGDTGIVKSNHGYHIMYFVGLGEQKSSDKRIETALKNEKLSNWSNELMEGANIERHDFGMKFVGRSGFFASLFASPAKPQATNAPTSPPTEKSTDASIQPSKTTEESEETTSIETAIE